MSDHTNCRQLVESLSEYVDGSLDDTLCAELERHLDECDNCQVVVNTLKKTIELYRVSDKNENVPAEVRARLYARLNLDDFLRCGEKDPTSSRTVGERGE